ncbi:MAG: class I SAM-dependent methyltransferase [bacterium]|nr:class I SAM-dependent methyltransferase [bacterium]
MAFYDDTQYSYDLFWEGREYEHHSEVMALEKLLGDKKLNVVADIGGGYGRLTRWLAGHSQKVYLVEPSAKMRSLAKTHLAKYPQAVIRPGSVGDTNLPPKSVDAILLVRVLHHLPAPASAIIELRRILKPHGYLVLEFANSAHFLQRLKSWLTGKPILPTATERRSPQHIAQGTIPFVNHHPLTVQKLLKRQGFAIVKVLSVSNFRHHIFKKLVPFRTLISLESWCQENLTGLYFGPSIFVLAQRLDRSVDL